MSKRARQAQQRARRQAAVLRERLRRRRNRLSAAAAAVGALVLVLGIFIVVKVAGGDASAAPPPASSAYSAEVVRAVSTISPEVAAAVGRGTVASLPKRLKGQPKLTSNGKPLIVYLGAEYCPFCAAQRWGIVVALSRFGAFTDLNVSRSASDDIYPNTPTFTFHGARYVSPYLEFQGVEMNSNMRKGRGYEVLDTPTEQQLSILRTYDAPPYVSADSAGAIPFVDFANAFYAAGSSIDTRVLTGKSAQQIAAALADPADPIAQAVLGSANAFTTILCELTANQPANVCSSPAATAYTGRLG